MSFPKRSYAELDCDFVESLISTISALGADWRYDEDVTQLEHAVQAAMLARNAGEPSEVIAAALLHDVGHFLMYQKARHDQPDGDDLKHESVGANWLAKYFVDAVSEPVRFHVPAKRYLCATRPGYWDDLSEGSRISLRKQGGPMSRKEQESFESQPAHQVAIRLREYDDQAKVVGMKIDPIDSFTQELLDSLKPRANA